MAADRHYEGTAYASDGGRVVYREEHWLYTANGVPTRLVLYRCPSGEAFARKWMHEVAGELAPDFELYDARDGYREGVRSHDGQREVFVQANRSAAMHAEPLPARNGAVIDAGFDAYVRAHWDALAPGHSAQIPFLVPSRMGYVQLRLDGASDDMSHGESVRHLHMSLDAWYGFVAPSVTLTYDLADHRLRGFEGVSNIRDAAGKNQRVRIDFPASAVSAPPDAAAIQQAAATPLSGRCPA